MEAWGWGGSTTRTPRLGPTVDNGTYSYEFRGDETEDGMRGETQDITATQTVQIFLNDSYKIKDMKFV